MTVTLLHNTPLHIAAKSIRKCWASQDKSDTALQEICNSCDSTNTKETNNGAYCKDCGSEDIRISTICGPNDKALIDRVGNKFKHASTLEHLTYNFDIDGISRACLQELARHRMTSLSVKSTRYTLKELKDEKPFLTDELTWSAIQSVCYDGKDMYHDAGVKRAGQYLVFTGNQAADAASVIALENLRLVLKGNPVCTERNASNDIAKYCLPEAYKTSLAWTINARSLQNFLSLRSNPSALWEIRDLAKNIYEAIPEDHEYLFKDSMYSKPTIKEV